MALTFPVRPPPWQLRLAWLILAAHALLLGASWLTGHGEYALFTIPPCLGAVAAVTCPESILRATLRVLLVLVSVALLTALGGGYWLLIPYTVLLSLPVWLPLVWLGAFSSAVAIRAHRTRPASSPLVADLPG